MLGLDVLEKRHVAGLDVLEKRHVEGLDVLMYWAGGMVMTDAGPFICECRLVPVGLVSLGILSLFKSNS